MGHNTKTHERMTSRTVRLAAAVAMGIVLAASYGRASAADEGKLPPISAKARPKPWINAWTPTNGPIRGIIFNARGLIFSGEVREPWRGFCERHGLAWCELPSDWDLGLDVLKGIAAELGRPELVNAPVIWAGLSASSHWGIMFAQQHPDRVLAVMGAVPVVPFVKGNDGFNFNRPKLNGLHQATQDISRTLGVPMLIQAGARDSICGSAPAYGFVKYGRKQDAPWTYYCTDNHHNAPAKPNVEMPWLEAVLAQRLSADVDLRQGPPTLKSIKVDAGWLGNTQTRAIDAYSKYDGDRAKASWLPDKASAEAWKNHGVGMPYEFPEQPLRQPSGLISDLAVHAKHNRVIPSDAAYGDAWKIVANLKEGDTYCLTDDERFCMTVVGKVPELVRGCDWIKPDGRAVDFTGEVLLEFIVGDAAIVYVGHDEKVVKRPGWLDDWTDTGEAVLGGYLGNEHRFRLLAKAFPKNARVKLGPNGEHPENPQKWRNYEGWIYMTIVKKPPARPSRTE